MRFWRRLGVFRLLGPELAIAPFHSYPFCGELASLLRRHAANVKIREYFTTIFTLSTLHQKGERPIGQDGSKLHKLSSFGYQPGILNRLILE